MKFPLVICTVFSVMAAGIAAEPATPPPKALPPLGSQSLTRRISIKMRVDGTDEVIVHKGGVSIHHVDWERPIEISVNGRKWKPAWNVNDTDAFTTFAPELAPFVGAKVEVKQAKGRGETTVIEQPSEANGQKLVIRLRDAGGGASDFEVRITW